MDNTENILETLNDFKRDLKRIFSSDKVESIKTDLIRTEIGRFCKEDVKRVENQLEDVVDKINSPIQIALLGRYSHGKSSLVNALFQIDDIHKLPDGPGIVTSKITHVRFHERKEDVVKVALDEEETSIGFEQFQDEVQGNGDKELLSSVDYYKMFLPIGSSDIARQFAKNNIELVDMPGLGGRYFHDTETTRERLDDMDMVIVPIKITEIEEAADKIKYFLDNVKVPIIPVFTFEDEGLKSPMYRDCLGDPEKMFSKAREILLKENNLPKLRSSVTNLISLPSIKDENGKEHPNVDNLRFMIRRLVSNSRQKTKVAKVYKRHVDVIIRTLSAFNEQIKRLKDDCEKRTKNMSTKKGKLSFDEIISNDKSLQRSRERLELEINQIISECYSEIQSRASEILSTDSKDMLEGKVASVKTNLNTSFKSRAKKINDRLNDYLLELRAVLEKMIDGMQIPDTTKSEKKQQIEMDINLKRSVLTWNDVLTYNYDTDKLSGATVGLGKAQDTLESIMNLNSLILLGVGILIFILPIIPPSWKIIGIIPIAVALLPALTANQKQNEAFNKWKNKVYTEMINCFSQTSKQDEAKEKIKIFLDELVAKIKESIESILDDYGTDIESIKRMNEYLTIKVNETSNKIEEELIDLRMGLETR